MDSFLEAKSQPHKLISKCSHLYLSLQSHFKQTQIF